MAQNDAAATKKGYHCPFCDQAIQEAKLPWCQACGVKLTYCSKCGQPMAAESKSCPHCGAKIARK